MNVHADHLTLQYCPEDRLLLAEGASVPIGKEVAIIVIGAAANSLVQAANISMTDDVLTGAREYLYGMC